MNPYEEGNDENESFPSLDSLFEDDDNNVTGGVKQDESNSLSGIGGAGPSLEQVSKTSTKVASQPKKDTTDIDIQKELEAKFDELFGALDDDDLDT